MAKIKGVWPSAGAQRKWDDEVENYSRMMSKTIDDSRFGLRCYNAGSNKNIQAIKDLGIKTMGDFYRALKDGTLRKNKIYIPRDTLMRHEFENKPEAYESEEWWKTPYGRKFILQYNRMEKEKDRTRTQINVERQLKRDERRMASEMFGYDISKKDGEK